MTDLTPKSSTPWWSLFNCCHQPSGVEQDGYTNEDNITTAPSPKVVVGEAIPLPGTPASACTGSSTDDSFESQGSDFVREKIVTFEDEDEFFGEVAVSRPQCSNKTSSPEKYMDDTGEANLTSLDENQSPMKASSTENTQNTMDNTDIEDTKQTTNKSTQDQLEVKFYQFMLLMMMRHMFGSWVPELDEAMQNIFKNKPLLTQYGSKGEKKAFRKMMTLRTLQFNDNSTCDVVPQLKREC